MTSAAKGRAVLLTVVEAALQVAAFLEQSMEPQRPALHLGPSACRADVLVCRYRQLEATWLCLPCILWTLPKLRLVAVAVPTSALTGFRSFHHAWTPYCTF